LEDGCISEKIYIIISIFNDITVDFDLIFARLGI